RQITRLGRTHPRSLRRGEPLGRGHVGPVTDHRVRRPDGGYLRQLRERRGLLELPGNLGGRTADERTDAVLSRRHLSLAGGNRGQRRAELRLSPLRIERAAAPRVAPLLGKVGRAPLVLGVPLGHYDLLLRSPPLELGAGHLRGQADL